MDLKPIEKLKPFRHFCMTIGELPSSYMESMTYLELLMWLCKYLENTVIPAINNNAQAVEELQTLFVQLHDYVENYFDNLDVQDEIDHKLDEMVEDGTLITILANYLPFITFEMYGAEGDGTTDDTTAVSTALNTGYKIVGIPGKTYLIGSNINITKDVDINLSGATIKSTNGNTLNIANGCERITILNGEFDKVQIIDTIDTETNYHLNNLYIHDTNLYGLKLDYVDSFYAEKCNFDNIGSGDIDINNQGIAIRINYANYVNINNSIFTYSHGTGATVIRNTKEMYITNNYYNNNDYRAIVPADDNALFVCKGLIANNHIENCGVNASHHTGVGCNGIYANSRGDIKDLVVSGNYIKNVCENGIEGRFGVVEYNIVDGTGVDQINHPTPSASGINMYGGIYRYNIVKNSYLAGLYVSGESHSQDITISNKKIYGNNIGKSTNTPAQAIYINATEYNNIEVYDNISDGYITIAPAAKYNNCLFNNNHNKQGVPYNVASAPTYLNDSGTITYGGFIWSDDSITNITPSHVTYSITDGVTTFVSTASNGAFSVTIPSNKNTITALKILLDTTENATSVKVTAYGIKDDNTSTTIAYNRNINKYNDMVGMFVENNGEYKSIKFVITIGDENQTLKIKLVQGKEILY